MSDITIQDLQEKIKLVNKDIESLHTSGDASRKLEMLNEYKKYLEDEIKFLKNEQRSGKSPK